MREFWLDPLLSPPNSIYTEPSEHCIHTIEIAAVEQLKAENEKLKSLFSVQLDVMEQNNNMTTEIQQLKSRLLDFEGRTYSENQEIAALKSKLKVAVDVLNTIAFDGSSRENCTRIATKALEEIGEIK